jgi:hypothetical protein
MKVRPNTGPVGGVTVELSVVEVLALFNILVRTAREIGTNTSQRTPGVGATTITTRPQAP